MLELTNHNKLNAFEKDSEDRSRYPEIQIEPSKGEMTAVIDDSKKKRKTMPMPPSHGLSVTPSPPPKTNNHNQKANNLNKSVTSISALP